MIDTQKSRTYLKNWAGLLGFGLFVLVVAVYYVSHKPFSPEIALNLAGIVWRAIAAIFIWGVAGGLGHRLIGRLAVSNMENFAIQAAFGLGLFGTAWLLIGSTLGFGSIQGVAIGLALGILLFKDIRAWADQLSDSRIAWAASGRFGKLVGVEIAIILIATFTISAAPPVKFDALVYHLRLPHLYLDNGRFFYVPEIMFWGMPQLGEMLYTWAISIAGDPSAALLSWLAGLTALIGLFGLLKERLGLPAAWSGLAALLAGYSLAISLSWAYVDWIVILFGTAFLISIHAMLKLRNFKWLAISGAFAGMALGTKYTAGILILSGSFLIVWDAFRQKKFSHAVRSLLLFWIAGLIFFIPWLIKNTIYTGSPIYPFLFPAGAMDQIRLDFYQGGTAWGNWQDILFLPWRATVLGIEGAPGYSASVGPLLLSLSVMVWLGVDRFSAGKRHIITTTGLLIAPVIVLWMIFGRFSFYLLQSRLYLGIFPAVALLAGTGYQAISTFRISSVRFGRLIAGLILFVMGLTVFEVGAASLRQESLSYTVGLQSENDYRQHNLGVYSLAMDEINDLPAGSKVLFIWEPRSLGCTITCDPDEILDRWPHDLAIYKDISAIQAAWEKQGYTHLLYYQLGADFLQQEDERFKHVNWASLEELKGRLIMEKEIQGAYSLYKIR